MPLGTVTGDNVLNLNNNAVHTIYTRYSSKKFLVFLQLRQHSLCERNEMHYHALRYKDSA